VRADYQSWGRFPAVRQTVRPLFWRDVDLDSAAGGPGPLLAYGNGRSYGDSCLNDGGILLDARPLDRFIAFDPRAGRVHCEAGVMLHELIQVVMPHGWFPAVVPGTRFVTVGGAIANDVHGKNHHRLGSFGHHVVGLELLRSDEGRTWCSSSENEPLFRATIGGIGLTGVILSAELALTRVFGPDVEVERVLFDSLDAYLALAQASDRDHEHTVAWIDSHATGAATGRGVLFRGDGRAGPIPAGNVRGEARIRVPFAPPFSLLSGPTTRIFNAAYGSMQRMHPARSRVNLLRFLFPLDGVRDWNRLYGRHGFLQYQCVIPHRCARDALLAILQTTTRHGEGSFLAVLKTFGDCPPAGVLSFPRAGVTMALDFPQRGERTSRLLDRLDAIVDEAGGALYPAKDARMPAYRFQRFFPAWEKLEARRDPRFSSSFWRRVTGEAT